MPGLKISPYINSNKPETKPAIPRVDNAPHDVETPTPTGCLPKSNLGFVEPAPPGEDNTSSPDQKSLHTSKTPAYRGRKRWPP